MDFSRHPCGVPVNVKNADKINHIMSISWKIQKGLRVSNSCMIVNVMLHRYLKAIGVHANTIYSVYNNGVKFPHVWLDIEGHVVDNTFVEDIPELLLKTTKESSTYRATPVKEEDLILGYHVTQSQGIDDHDITQFEWMLLNEDKSFALSKNKLQLGQYFKIMTDYMLLKYKAKVEQISEMFVTNCWCCNRSDFFLKVCGNCKIL